MRSGHAFHWEIDGGSDLYVADTAGFRTHPAAVQNDDSTLEIAVAGDSFTFGTGVAYAETFGALLGELVQARVRNLAMPGYGIDQIWMSVRHQVLPSRPDLVVFAFVDADFARSLTAFRRSEGRNKPTFLVENGELRRQAPSDRPNAVLRFLEGLGLAQLSARAMRLVGRHFPIGVWWHRNAAILSAVHQDCAAAGVPISFVRLPSRRARSFPLLERFMEELGAVYLDLGTSFPDGVHFANDPHINERGHRWVAERIGEWIAGEPGLERVELESENE